MEILSILFDSNLLIERVTNGTKENYNVSKLVYKNYEKLNQISIIQNLFEFNIYLFCFRLEDLGISFSKLSDLYSCIFAVFVDVIILQI